MPEDKRVKSQESRVKGKKGAKPHLPHVSLLLTLKTWWHKNHWNKALALFLAGLIVLTSAMYGVARWYQASIADQPLRLGTSFIPAYAESLGLDAQETMDAILQDIDIKHLRLVSYWNQLEPEAGNYDFELLDWQFEKAEAAGAKVSLALGLRQPRWPECHMPEWAQDLPDKQWKQHLNDFIAKTVNRYKQSPALESFQLENEYFLESFGTCEDFSRQRLISEYNLIKSLDPIHPIIMSRSNNLPSLPLGEPVPDEYSFSVYRRVWDGTYTKRYLQYPLPPWYYSFLAGMQKITRGRDSILHELQAEAWPPHGQSIRDTSLSEQNKSLNASRLRDRFQFGENTGLRDIYLWGAEYWYYRLIELDDPSLWRVAKEEFAREHN